MNGVLLRIDCGMKKFEVLGGGGGLLSGINIDR